MSVSEVLKDYRRIYKTVSRLGGAKLSPEVAANASLELLNSAEKRVKDAQTAALADRLGNLLKPPPRHAPHYDSALELGKPPAPETETNLGEYTPTSV